VNRIAYGRDADVFALGPSRVLRRYRAGGDTTHEAAVMRHVASFGYPVPSVFEASGPDLVLERVAGPTLLAALVAGSVEARETAEVLGDLHARLHAVPPRAGAEEPVVHLDLHPDNVILGPEGPVLIDWRNATDGPAALDLAVTALVLALFATHADHPLASPARDVLSAFVPMAHGDVVKGLPGAVRRRSADRGLTAAEKRRLPDAEALVRALAA
jgi:Ser/Thr protein kinase RdoA (MazF antagonist)